MRRSIGSAGLVAAVVGLGALVALRGTGTPMAAAKQVKNGAVHLKVKARTTNTAVAHRTHTASGPHADGTVTAVNGNTITVKADDDTNASASNEYKGVTTIVLSDATTYRGSATKASIVAGAVVIAEGTISTDGTTLTATSIGVGGPRGHGGPGGHGHGGPHADGTVSAVSGNTVTVAADNDPAGSDEYTKVTTILLTDSTTYGHNATKASIVAGASIAAEGTVSSDGTTLTATRVDVRPAGGAPDAHAHNGPHHP
jgi:hypothetical protein